MNGTIYSNTVAIVGSMTLSHLLVVVEPNAADRDDLQVDLDLQILLLAELVPHFGQGTVWNELLKFCL